MSYMNNIRFTKEQRDIIESKERVVIVEGVPGCGKTTTLVNKNLNRRVKTKFSKKDENKLLQYIFGYLNPKYYKKKNIIILPSYFKNIFENMELKDNNSIFNICILYDYVYSNDIYSNNFYMINNSDNFFESKDLKKTINNIITYITDKKISIEIPCKPIIYIESDKKILKEELFINDDNYETTINGRIDGFHDSTLYEFKISKNEYLSNDWIIQVLLYKLLGIQKSTYEINNIKIVNFIEGCEYIIPREKLYELIYNEELIKHLFNDILEAFNFKKNHKTNVFKKILKLININQ